jgi:K(+)-stimulated pyrophosphate-energized sodium pump
MNLVSVLIAPAIVQFSVGKDANAGVRIVIALVAVAVIVAAILVAKRRASSLDDNPADAQATARVG